MVKGARRLAAAAIVLVSAIAPASADELARLRDIVARMTPGVWHELPGTSMAGVLATRAEAPYNGGISGPPSVIYAWNGAAFDGKRWWFHGGGHHDYSGNEVYQFDFGSLSWSRLTNPSPMHPVTPEAKCPDTVDNTPLSGHTYDGFVWVPKTRTVFLWPSVLFCPPYNGQGGPVGIWEFNPDTRKWAARVRPTDSYYYKTAIDPVSGNVLVHTLKHLYEFDPVTGKIGRRSPEGRWADVGTMEYDPKRKTIWMVRDVLLAADNSNPLGIGRMEQVAPGPKIDGAGVSGMALFPERDVLVFWAGGRQVATFDLNARRYDLYPNTRGPAPSPAGSGVYSKWVFIPAVGVFAGYTNLGQGVWLYKLPDQPPPPPKTVAGFRRVCPTERWDENCDYGLVSEALAAAKDGETITIRAGVYEDAGALRANRVTIKAEAGAHIRNRAVEGKAALVIKGNDTVIEGLECSGVKVPDDNGACIRIEGRNLTLRRVFFHHSQSGVLGGRNTGTVVIEDSRFEDMVGASQRPGSAHALYIGATDVFEFRRNRVLRTGGQGHGVKSRARRNVIEHNVIASLNAQSSRAIDVSEGGDTVIRNNVIEQGAQADNSDLIGVALEKLPDGLEHRTVIAGNLVLCDRPQCWLVSHRSPGQVTIEGNRFVGAITPAGDKMPVTEVKNSRSTDRAAAKLPPFPQLPAVSQ